MDANQDRKARQDDGAPRGARHRATAGALGFILVASLALSCTRPSPPRVDTEAPPQRIVSLLILADEVLWRLGEEVRTRVVGVSQLVDDPRYSNAVDLWPAATARVTSASEVIVALRPDLVIAGSFTSQELRSFLGQVGIPVLVIESLDDFAAYRKNVAAIAEAVGATTAGRKIVEDFDRRLQAIRTPVPTGAPTIASWAEGIVAGEGTTFHDAATAAGFVNAAAKAGHRGHQRITLEQLVLWSPEVIIVGCNPGTCDQVAVRQGSQVGFRDMPAVRAGRLAAIENRVLTSTGFEMLDLVEALRRRREAPPKP